MKKNTSFTPHIMFITKPEIMNNWFNELFKWLEKCEKIFNFDNLKGYDTERLFAYLSERYLSYWFKKHLKYKEENCEYESAANISFPWEKVVTITGGG